MRFLSQYVHYADNLKETIEANYKRIKQEVLIREFGIRKGLKKLVISSKIRIFIGENQ